MSETRAQFELETGDERLAPWAGVTTVVHATVNPGDGLLKWAWKQGQKGVWLTDARSNQDRTSGLLVHKTLERLALGERPVIRDLPVQSRTRVEHLLTWWDDTRPTILASELALQHDGLRLRGRLDYVRECDDPGCECASRTLPDGGLGHRGAVIGDLATGADPVSPRVAATKRWQVGGGYRILWQGARVDGDLTRRPLCGCEVVHLPNDRPFDDGDRYRVVAADGDPAVFLAALTLYRDMQAHGDLPERTL